MISRLSEEHQRVPRACLKVEQWVMNTPDQDLPPNDDNALVTTQLETAVTTTDADGTQKKTKKIIRRKGRLARPQVDPATLKSEPPPQTGPVFNLWYTCRQNVKSAHLHAHETAGSKCMAQADTV
ncbi:hypothetical protein BJY04DRAFT_221672 [Aspergillus karnatakaensis]|uniref:uncharacterized protein n=1 Tax=Aspergillus karnatakaensis TaxID=1810916 RepID=UPI003CCCF382